MDVGRGAQHAVGLELDVGDFDAIRRAWVTDCPADRPRLALRTRCKTTRKSEAERVLRDELLRAARVGAEVLNLRLPGLADTGASESSFFRYGETMNFAYRLLRETRLDAEAAGVGMAIEVAVDDWLASPSRPATCSTRSVLVPSECASMRRGSIDRRPFSIGSARSRAE